MSTPLQRVRLYFSRRDPDAPPPQDDRSLLQVLIGAVIGGVVAGLLSALFGSDLPGSIGFGLAIGLLFLFIDLQARRKRREGPPGG